MKQTNTTPVPNILFDVHLKELKSAELKMLLVIIRQTLGWADNKAIKGRKEIDWISASQLQEKTGSCRRAITTATKALVKRKLIDVLDERGNLLCSGDMRQGKLRLFYRLSGTVENQWKDPCITDVTYAKNVDDLRKNVTSLVQKMRITKETLQN